MSYCYILYSKILDRYYTGVTREAIEMRIAKHNNGSYGQHRYTAKASDWQLYVLLNCDDYAHAVRIERYLKKMKSRKFIEELKNDAAKQVALIERSRKST